MSGKQRADRTTARPAPTGPGIFETVLGSPGQSLEPAVRALMESRFGHDFSHVRVHADARAGESADLIGASGYTYGPHVVFGPGRFDPGSEAGRDLISHELAHSIQQQGASPRDTGSAGEHEAEADHAARQVAGGRPVGPLTRSWVTVARQPSGQMPRTPEEIDAQIELIRIEMLTLAMVPGMRVMLLARLRQLQMARQRFGPPAPTVKTEAAAKQAREAEAAKAEAAAKQARDAALAKHIDDHPAWGWGTHGGKGSPEGYAEIEANTSGDDFERTDLYREWYFSGWAAIAKRPDPGRDLQTLAFHLITDPVQRNELLTSVGLTGPGTQPIAAPRSLTGPLDLGKMTEAEKQAEVDAIRVWQQRQKLDPQLHNRLTQVLTELTADLAKGRAVTEASALPTLAVTYDTFHKAVGAAPGFSGAYGQYGNVDIDYMMRGRDVAESDSDTPMFFRFVHHGKEISSAEAQRLANASGIVDKGALEPSIGSADRFVVLPETWQLGNGDVLIQEVWWVIRTNPDKAERMRRMMVSNHRGKIYPSSDDNDYGMGHFGSIGVKTGPPGRVAGVRSGWKRGGGPPTTAPIRTGSTAGEQPKAAAPHLDETPAPVPVKRQVYHDGEMHEVTSDPQVTYKRGTAGGKADEPVTAPKVTKPDPAARDLQRKQEVAAEFDKAQRGVSHEPGYRRDDPRWTKKTAQLEENRTGGRLNEEYLRRTLKTKLNNEYDNVADQVRIRPNRDDGKPADFYFIPDHLASERASGQTVAIDAKFGPGTQLTNTQRIGYPMLARNGGTVVSRNQPLYPYGTKLPPTQGVRAQPTVDLWTTPRPPQGEMDFGFTPIQ